MQETISNLFKNISLPAWVVGLFSRFGRWFIIAASIWILASLVANFVYYSTSLLSDGPELKSFIAEPDQPNSEINQAIQVVVPRRILYITEPYSITIHSTSTLTQEITVSLADTQGLIVDPNQSLEFNFKPDIYQTYAFTVRNNIGTVGKALLSFTHPLSPSGKAYVSLQKEIRLEAFFRNVLILTSFREFIIPVITGVIVVLSALGQKEQEVTQKLVEQFDQEAKSFKPNLRAYDYLRYRLNNLSSQEAQRIRNINDFTAEQHLVHLRSGGGSKDEHIGRLLALRDPHIAAQLFDLERTGAIPLMYPQARLRIIEIQSRNPSSRQFQTTSPLDAPSLDGGGFSVDSELAENDNASYYRPEVFPGLEAFKMIYDQVTNNPSITTSICGVDGCGKTALLRGLAYEVGQQGDRLFPIMINARGYLIFQGRFLIFQRTWLKKILAILAKHLCNVMYREPKDWINLPQELQLDLFDEYIRQLPIALLDQFVQQVEQVNAIEGRRLRDLLVQYQGFWGSIRRYSKKYRWRRFSPCTQQMMDIVKQLGYEKVLLCLDNVDNAFNATHVRNYFDHRFLHFPVLLVVSYKSSVEVAHVKAKKNVNVVELVWSSEQLKILLEKRNTGELQASTIEAISRITKVPRDLWPWWHLFTIVQRSFQPNARVVTTDEQDRLFGLMEQTQQKRISSWSPWKRLTRNTRRWIMGDCYQVLKSWNKGNNL